MGAAQWIVTIVGVILIIGIAWFFWGPKKGGQQAEVGASGYQEVSIRVKGSYSPDRIVVKKGKPVRLKFLREEANSCSEMVVFPDFDKSSMLPQGKTVTVELLPTNTGNFPFSCQMGMYRGMLVVEE